MATIVKNRPHHALARMALRLAQVLLALSATCVVDRSALAAGANEAHLTSGDSGGGVFIEDGGLWKLAGINYAVDGPFSFTEGGTLFNAALFDMGGLFRANTEIPDLAGDEPSGFYATRISSHEAWILAAVPEPAHTTLVTAAVLGLIALQGWRRERNRSKNA